MCGLVGFIGQIHEKERTAFHWLLHFDAIRGFHSTGVAAIHQGKDATDIAVFKELGLPENLYRTYPEQWPNYVYGRKDVTCLIGHNRWATQGGISKETAHPFEFENVVGAHNGTIDKWSMRNLAGGKVHDIDSKIVYDHLSSSGNNVQELWDAADGAMALTWWNKKKNVFHIARNKERSLYTTKLKHKNTIAWASEPWMLRVALDKGRIDHEDIIPVPVDTLFTYSFEDNKVKITSSPLKPFVKYKFQSFSGGNQTIFTQGVHQNENRNYFKDDKKDGLPETVWMKVTEYNAPNHNAAVWCGVFFGVMQDGKEIRISTAGSAQEKHYSTIMKACDDKRPYFSFKKSSAYDMYNMLNVHACNIVHAEHIVKAPWLDVKVDKKKTVKGFNDSKLTAGQFMIDYDNVCCCCNNSVSFEEVLKDQEEQNNSFFFLDDTNIICPICMEDDWVQDNLLPYHSLTSQQKDKFNAYHQQY